MPCITPVRKRKLPAKCNDAGSVVESEDSGCCYLPSQSHASRSVAVQTTENICSYSELQNEIAELKQKLVSSTFRLSNIMQNDQKILFYTGFPNYYTLKACYDCLGPAVNSLHYWGSMQSTTEGKSSRGRSRSLPPIEEFFLVLVRLRLGLFERDLADRFGILVPTVSRICITWTNFLYWKLKKLLLWPKREMVKSYMPRVFKDLYPTTRVIIDATEVFVETPSLPELQQMTFSSYKNHNTFKGLIGISPGCAITFVSNLFPGSVSDKQLTQKSGLLDVLEEGDSVMADRGFDIQDVLTPLGVNSTCLHF